MTLETVELAAFDDHTIKTFDWRPANNEVRAVIQILHGMGEHAARYDRFASACNLRGVAAVSHNHRGHGQPDESGHFDDEDGWEKVVADVLQVRRYITETYPQRPVILLGHSMGSFIAQSVVQRHGNDIAALILSGSTLANRIELYASLFAATAFKSISGKRAKSHFLNQAGLGNFNRPFRPSRTDYDWLSRDETEVDHYVADPLCGGLFSNQFWIDLTAGLIEVSDHRSIGLIRHDLPILITGGEVDPVGGREGLTKLAEAYRRTGHDAVTLKIYADARHEMLNETNRDEVTAEIISWIEQILAA
ncbi:MAG: alpha/beta fold hydrolase [Woeseiaceae bacterium]